MQENKIFVMKICLYFGFQIYGLNQAHPLNLLITLYGAFWKTKQIQLPIQILVHLRLLLRRNGLIWFDDISTILGYSMPNLSLYSSISNSTV